MDRTTLLNTIATLQSQRAALGDAVTDSVLAPLLAQVAALDRQAPARTQPGAGEGVEPPAQLLRQVSVLFADIVGSTALSGQLDPEDTADILDGALARLTDVVRRGGGRVLQYAGDNLLAAFGVDGSREDDAERAVRCGLALLAEAGSGALAGPAAPAAGLRLRVGIHTGTVLLGGGVGGESSIRGVAVHAAARMEQTAPPGGLRISQETYRLVRGLFEVQPQPPLAVKGIAEPMRSVLVTRALPRGTGSLLRGVEGVATPMVGREAELARLRDALAAVRAGRAPALLTIVGEAGLGKSRLLAEFLDGCAGGASAPRVLRARATPQTPVQPYGLLRDLFLRWLRVGDDDTLDLARQRFEHGLAPWLAAPAGDTAAAADAPSHALGHLLGIDFGHSAALRGLREDPRRLRQLALQTARQALLALAERSPCALVLALEDLHWCDDESLDFLAALSAGPQAQPVLVLATARPSLLERRPAWSPDGTAATGFELQPLDDEAQACLAGELLQRLPERPPALLDVVRGDGDGNPFFMEERVNLLIDQGAIDTTPGGDGEGGAGTWRLHRERLQLTRVPGTLVGVLQARLDALSAAERETLQAASVVGPVFPEAALRAIEPRAGDVLPALIRRGLAVAAAGVPGTYRFRHHALQQVTYETVLRRRRRDLHARLGDWLAGSGEPGVGEQPGVVAWHYEQAERGLDAARFHALAAAHAAARFAHDAVRDHATRGLAQAAATAEPALRWKLLDARESSHALQGRREPQRADLDALQALADELDDDFKRADIGCRRAMAAMRTADYAACANLARHTVELAHRCGATELRLHATQQWCAAMSCLGDSAPAEALARQGLDEARAHGLPAAEALFLNLLSFLASQRDDRVALREYCQQTLALAHANGNRVLEAVALLNLGVTELDIGLFDDASRTLEAALRMLRATGDRPVESSALASLATLALYRGDAASAVDWARQGVEIAAAAEAREHLGTCWLRLGQAESARGRHDAASDAMLRAESIFQQLGHARLHDTHGALAQAALARGDRDAALQYARRLLDHLDRGGTLDGAELKPVCLALYRALSASRDPRAAGWLRRAHDDLHAEAARFTDEALRESFLHNPPHNRALLDAWRDAGPATAAARGG